MEEAGVRGRQVEKLFNTHSGLSSGEHQKISAPAAQGEDFHSSQEKISMQQTDGHRTHFIRDK